MTGVLSAFDHSQMKAYIEGIAQMYEARQRASHARIDVAECEAALAVARARLVEAEAAERLTADLTDVLDGYMEKLSERLDAGPQEDSRDA